MSARINIFSISSLAPIQEAIASNDKSLAEKIREQSQTSIYGEIFEDEDFLNEIIENMIMSDTPAENESGYWQFIILLIAEVLNLGLEDDYSFNDGWKHYRVWGDYKYLLGKHLTEDALNLLSRLESGRPLKGSNVDDSDAVAYSYLLPEEVYRLHSCLSHSNIEDEDYVSFHKTFLESLKAIYDRKSVLFYTAR